MTGVAGGVSGWDAVDEAAVERYEADGFLLVRDAIPREVVEAAAKRKDEAVLAKLKKFEASRPNPQQNFLALEPYFATLEGGDAVKGKKSFFENVAISCARCHQVGNQGG